MVQPWLIKPGRSRNWVIACWKMIEKCLKNVHEKQKYNIFLGFIENILDTPISHLPPYNAERNSQCLQVQKNISATHDVVVMRGIG